MSYIFRNGCQVCKKLQPVSNISRVGYYQFYSNSRKLPRGIKTWSCALSSDKPIKRGYIPSELLDQSSGIFQSNAEVLTPFKSIEHDMADNETFDYLKEAFSERFDTEQVQFTEMQSGFGSEVGSGLNNAELVEQILDNTKNNAAVQRKRKRQKESSKYERGNQLTEYGENNVLAEIDIYMYLGELDKAVDLFNYHRRHGHRFGVDVYNKILNVWAKKKSWKNIKLLLHCMKKENVEPTYQTYAGLLEACGNIGNGARVHVKDIVEEMHSKNMTIKELFTVSLLTKQQINSIQCALHMVNMRYVSEGDKKEVQIDGNGSSSIKAQIEQEMKGTVTMRSIGKPKELHASVLKRSKIYERTVETWKKDFILEIIKLRKNRKLKNFKFVHERCVNYSCVVTPEELSDIVFDSIIPLILSQLQGVPVALVCTRLGNMIYTKYCLKCQEDMGIVDRVKKVACEYYSTTQNQNDADKIPRETWKNISEKHLPLPSEELLPSVWSHKIKVRASSVIIDILMKVTTMDTRWLLRDNGGETLSTLSHEYITINQYQKVGILKFHPVIFRLYNSYSSKIGDIEFEANKIPMVTYPKPWIKRNIGGYLLLPSPFVRFGNEPYKGKQGKVSEEYDISKVFDALNFVGNCAWKVNEKLLDIMIELFNGKGDLNLDIIGSDIIDDLRVKMKKSRNAKERKLARKEYHEFFALHMDLLYKLTVANYFRDKVLWNPNNLDFRGRVYPVSPHCCHIGNDLSRSMLMFAEGKKLGEKGLDWLKIHLVNVHGQMKKASLEERIRYANLHIDDIMDSADNPLTGRKWWQEGSDPWQTLIACMEVTDAIGSGNPAKFVSHLPVQQDGSCNGLQHYAALGRDIYGAKEVNLRPAEKPQDVYMEVANLVEKRRQKDAENNVLIAKQLEGKITRKVVKQTVMTVVYGVTFVGGRLQIEKQLKELNVENDMIFKASVYVVQEIFKSIHEMFTSARLIQDWLTVSAGQISLTGNCVDWVTPFNLHIVQPYHRKTTEHISTPLMSVTRSHFLDYTQTPNLVKQKGGFPPNFVHSLDSTHMMMTALRCQEENLVFTSVHDSFWTHAYDVDKLNRFCREKFIDLHKLPILENLKKHFDENYSGLPLRKPLKDGRSVCKFDELPELGEFDIDEVLDSPYFFS